MAGPPGQGAARAGHVSFARARLASGARLGFEEPILRSTVGRFARVTGPTPIIRSDSSSARTRSPRKLMLVIVGSAATTVASAVPAKVCLARGRER